MKTFFYIVLFSMGIFAQNVENSWADFKPFISHKNEIEKRFGTGKVDKSGFHFYSASEFGIRVNYSEGGCGPALHGRQAFDLPPERILEMDVNFRDLKKWKLNQIGIDVTKFRREVSDHVRPVVYYNENETGISIVAGIDDGEEFVWKISLLPPKELREKFRCSAGQR